MREFWVSSGHHLVNRMGDGSLAVTDELLMAYFARPELVPPDDACNHERVLHARLLENPRCAVSPDEIDRLVDADARENWALMISLRDRLVSSPSIENAYLSILRGGNSVPTLFLNQLVHLILRNALDSCVDPFVLRAAELFFRPQRALFHEGTVLLADAELMEELEDGRMLSPLVTMFGRDPGSNVDVLDSKNAWTYWSRSDAFSMALNLGSNSRSREGLARVVEVWVHHLLNVAVTVEPLERVEDWDWRWFVGLDAEATRIANALWNGEAVDDGLPSHLLATFRLTFPTDADVEPRAAGHPVYLILAMDPNRVVRAKPQNLILGLPLRATVETA
jgi:hypothetical protein